MQKIVLEKQVERTFCRKMARRGWMNLKIKNSLGWPDRMFLKDGKVIFVEFKRPNGGKLSKRQTLGLVELQVAGFNAVATNSAEDATIEKITNNTEGEIYFMDPA